MQQQDIFISKIAITNVRHLKNVEIELSETERKHLILTGRNGSGKTSVLMMIKATLQQREIEAKQHLYHHAIANSIENLTRQDWLQQRISQLSNEHLSLRQSVKNGRLEPSQLNLFFRDFSDEQISRVLAEPNFIFTHFRAKREAYLNVPNAVQPIANLAEMASADSKVGGLLLQYMVNLDYAKLRAEKKVSEPEQIARAASIDRWFAVFEGVLQDIFMDTELRLEYDDEHLRFTVKTSQREPFGLNELSEGYSALLAILGELILRMDSPELHGFNMQGIMLIDEIETHLHIELQKKVLPILTKLFPRIQFIVTTHSPFVLNSVDNAVIFDLEHQERVEDLSAYSVNAIIKAYFGNDEYSAELKEHLATYEDLLRREATLNDEERDHLEELEDYFDGAPKMYSPELALKLNQLAIARRSIQA
jgi:predicted ATP-dependent endonuclease of OLD family